MPYSRLRLPLAALLFAAALALNACKKDEKKPAADTTDRDLSALARATTGFTWFGHDAALRPKSSGSGHGEAFLRTRYDATAATQLDHATGRVRAGAVFGTGSLIVKELHQTATGGISQYAVMQRNPTNPNAAPNGWVWAEFNPDGSVSLSSASKGSGCTGCHGQAGHVDATLMNKFFP